MEARAGPVILEVRQELELELLLPRRVDVGVIARDEFEELADRLFVTLGIGAWYVGIVARQGLDREVF